MSRPAEHGGKRKSKRGATKSAVISLQDQKAELKKLMAERAKESAILGSLEKVHGLRGLLAAELNALWPKHEVPGVLIPFYDINGNERTDVFRARVLRPIVDAFGGISPHRYHQPTGTPPAAYFPLCCNWPAIAGDIATAITIVEGEFKAICLSSHELPTIGIGGVWGWKSQRQGWDFLPDLELINWQDRDVVINFDNDEKTETNDDVQYAVGSFTRELTRRGAKVRVLWLPLPSGTGVSNDK